MPKPHRNDISIGKDEWITCIELDGRQSNAFDLDPILEPIRPFLDTLETECVAACCGIDAYALWPDDIARATKNTDSINLAQRIDAVRTRIAASDADSFVSHRMNNYFDKQVLLQLIDHIADCVRNVGDAGEQGRPPEPRMGC